MGVPQNGWFIRENPIKVIKVDDLGVPPFMETLSCSSSLMFNRFKLFEIVVIPRQKAHFQT